MRRQLLTKLNAAHVYIRRRPCLPAFAALPGAAHAFHRPFHPSTSTLQQVARDPIAELRRQEESEFYDEEEPEAEGKLGKLIRDSIRVSELDDLRAGEQEGLIFWARRQRVRYQSRGICNSAWVILSRATIPAIDRQKLPLLLSTLTPPALPLQRPFHTDVKPMSLVARAISSHRPRSVKSLASWWLSGSSCNGWSKGLRKRSASSSLARAGGR